MKELVKPVALPTECPRCGTYVTPFIHGPLPSKQYGIRCFTCGLRNGGLKSLDEAILVWNAQAIQLISGGMIEAVVVADY